MAKKEKGNVKGFQYGYTHGDFHGKGIMIQTALVTGGANGIGKAVVLELAHRNVQVGFIDIDHKGLIQTQKEVNNNNTIYYQCDVSNESEVNTAFDYIINQQLHHLDIAINCAGILGTKNNIHDYPVNVWRNVIDVNLTGMFLCMQKELQIMLIQNKGVIVNFASLSGIDPNSETPPISAYAVSKAGVDFLTKLAIRQYPMLRICAIYPSGIATNLSNQLWDSIGYQKNVNEFAVEVVDFILEKLCKDVE